MSFLNVLEINLEGYFLAMSAFFMVSMAVAKVMGLLLALSILIASPKINPLKV